MSGTDAAAVKKPLTRFGEIELLKAMAIIGLPAVHTMEQALEYNFGSPGLTLIGNAVLVLCAFGPSVFMICMGFGIGGGRTSAKNIRSNGIQFLLIGFLLNIIRWLIPSLLCKIVLGRNMIQDIDFCFQSDIYYFAGLFFILYSFLKEKKIPTHGVILISVFMLTLNTLIASYVTRGMFPDLMDSNPTNDEIPSLIIGSLLGNIVYVDHTSCFPLLSWAIFPSIGVLLGEILKKTDEEKRSSIMGWILGSSVVMFISFVVFLKDYGIDVMKVLVSPENDYITDLPNVILLLSLALIMISLFYYLCRVIGASSFMAFMLNISTFIIPFYLLQWIIIAWIFYLMIIFRVPTGSFTIPIYLVTVAAVTAICLVVTSRHGMKIMKLLLRITSFKKNNRKKKAVN